MGRYLVKINDLGEKNKYLEEIIGEIKDCVENIDHMKEDVRWISHSKEKLMVKYDDYVLFLYKMLDNLDSCLNINKKYFFNYSEGYQSIKKDFRELSRDVEEKI